MLSIFREFLPTYFVWLGGDDANIYPVVLTAQIQMCPIFVSGDLTDLHVMWSEPAGHTWKIVSTREGTALTHPEEDVTRSPLNQRKHSP